MEGEAGFRRREREMIGALCKLDNIVLATGGGVVLDEKNRQQISETGVVIYLTASIDTQLRRIAQKGKMRRPLFIKNDSKEKLQQLNEIRKPLLSGNGKPRLSDGRSKSLPASHSNSSRY